MRDFSELITIKAWKPYKDYLYDNQNVKSNSNLNSILFWLEEDYKDLPPLWGNTNTNAFSCFAYQSVSPISTKMTIFKLVYDQQYRFPNLGSSILLKPGCFKSMILWYCNGQCYWAINVFYKYIGLLLACKVILLPDQFHQRVVNLCLIQSIWTHCPQQAVM